jgi:protein-tyrosine phosphatase
LACVLVVCTANVCRSPATAELLALGAGPDVRLTSAGLRAVAGQGRCSLTADWLAEIGVPLTAGHRSRPLTVALIREADLVLTMTRQHRSGVLRLLPSRQGSTFTLAQAARLGRWVLDQEIRPDGRPGSAERVHWMVDELDAARARAPMPDGPELDDVEDPHEGHHHAAILDTLRRDAAVLAHLLRL